MLKMFTVCLESWKEGGVFVSLESDWVNLTQFVYVIQYVIG